MRAPASAEPRRARRRGVRAVALVIALGALAACAPSVSRPQAAPTSAPTTAPVEVVTIGDSIMAGYVTPADDAWPALLARQTETGVQNLGCPGAGFARVGICGTTFAGLLPEIQGRPRLVLVQASSNDRHESAAAVDAATPATLRTLAASYPDAQIVGLSALWTDEAAVPARVTAASTALRAAVEAVGGTFVDVGQPFRGRRDLLQDGLHPTVEGQEVLAAQVYRALNDAGIRFGADPLG